MPPVPIPNPELIVYLGALLVVGLVTLVDDKTVFGANLGQLRQVGDRRVSGLPGSREAAQHHRSP